MLLSVFQKSFTREDVSIHQTVEPAGNNPLVNTQNDFYFPIPDYPSQIDIMRKQVKANQVRYPQYIL